MELLAHPFRVGSDGSIATVTDGTDAGNADAVARVCLTRVGELDLVPSFGIPDPTWDDVDVARVNACLSLFGPPVQVTVQSVSRTARVETVVLNVEAS